MQADLHTAEQIVALLQGPAGAIWELLTIERPRRASDIAIRDVDGSPVLYARPAA
ncbi:MAG: hypothetical protein IRZ14_07125 [Chloroflexi bacterium]|nr:hypothetical protein [Chloroflexota bacterium]